MSEQESTKGPFSSVFMGVVIVIATVAVVGGIFVFALVSGADHGTDHGPGPAEGAHAGEGIQGAEAAEGAEH